MTNILAGEALRQLVAVRERLDRLEANAMQTYSLGDMARMVIELDAKQERIAALDAALRALVATEPTYDDEGVGTRCGYCGGRRRSLSVTTTTIDHNDGCPWRAAKALVGE